MAQHSKIGASSCERWWNCPGSVKLEQEAPPRPDSFYAYQGTVAHELCERYFYNLDELPAEKGKVYTKDTFNVEVDDEMIEAVETYIDAISSDMIKHGVSRENLLLEQRFHLEDYSKDAYGTCDAVFIDEDNCIHVYDFKYGAGVPVDVLGNKQMLYYGLGAIEYFKQTGKEYTLRTVIIQPRAVHADGPIREAYYDHEFLEMWSGHLKIAMKRVEDEDPTLSPGDHCRWCAAKPNCPALKKKTQELARLEFGGEPDPPPPPQRYTPQEISKIVANAGYIRDWLTSVEEYAINQIIQGETIPNIKLVTGRGSRKWLDEESAKAILELMTDEPLYESKFVSPAKAEKLLPKEHRKSLAPLIEKQEGRLILAEASDPRPEATIRHISASDEFTPLT